MAVPSGTVTEKQRFLSVAESLYKQPPFHNPLHSPTATSQLSASANQLATTIPLSAAAVNQLSAANQSLGLLQAGPITPPPTLTAAVNQLAAANQFSGQAAVNQLAAANQMTASAVNQLVAANQLHLGATASTPFATGAGPFGGLSIQDPYVLSLTLSSHSGCGALNIVCVFDGSVMYILLTYSLLLLSLDTLCVVIVLYSCFMKKICGRYVFSGG